jgi:hypothetical protein
LGICTFTCDKYQRTAFGIYYSIEISKIKAETEETRQIEDDHPDYDYDIYHNFKKNLIFLDFTKGAGNVRCFPKPKTLVLD